MMDFISDRISRIFNYTKLSDLQIYYHNDENMKMLHESDSKVSILKYVQEQR